MSRGAGGTCYPRGKPEHAQQEDDQHEIERRLVGDKPSEQADREQAEGRSLHAFGPEQLGLVIRLCFPDRHVRQRGKAPQVHPSIGQQIDADHLASPDKPWPDPHGACRARPSPWHPH
jgi:hypothetical protein